MNSIFDDDSAILTFEAGALDSLQLDVGPEDKVVGGVDSEVAGFAQGRVDQNFSLVAVDFRTFDANRRSNVHPEY